MWQYNYEAACLFHSAKGTSWNDHKYIAKKNGKYIYPGGGKKEKTPEEIAKGVAKDIKGYQNKDLFKTDEIGKPITSRERAARKRRQHRLEKRQATEQAKTNSLRRNSVNRAKEAGAAVTERDRAWKATVRRTESVKRAKENGAEVSRRQAKELDIWKRKKAYADRINVSKIAERKRAINAVNLRKSSVNRAKENGAEVTKQQKEWQETKKKVKRERVMKAAKRAWDKFSKVPFKWKK